MRKSIFESNQGQLVNDVRTYYINAESKERELLKALIFDQSVSRYEMLHA